MTVPLLVGAHEPHERVRTWARGRELRLCGPAATRDARARGTPEAVGVSTELVV